MIIFSRRFEGGRGGKRKQSKIRVGKGLETRLVNNIVIVADLIYLHCKAKVLSKLGHTCKHTVSLTPRLLGVPRVD